MWIDTEGVLACLCLRDRNGFLGNIVLVEACKLVNAHPTLRTFSLHDSRRLERQSSSRVSQNLVPHMELRHDLGTPPRAEHDGILQSDEA